MQLKPSQPRTFLNGHQLKYRLRISLIFGLLVISILWLVSPTPRSLYKPLKHVQAKIGEGHPSSDGIVNSVVVPSYNEGDNMQPL